MGDYHIMQALDSNLDAIYLPPGMGAPITTFREQTPRVLLAFQIVEAALAYREEYLNGSVESETRARLALFALVDASAEEAG